MIWELLLRPDTAVALEQPNIKKALPRYIKVVKNESPAKFVITKLIPVDFDSEAREKELWEIHTKSLKKFYSIQEKIEAGKIKLANLKKPKKNLLDLKIAIANKILEHCYFCERRCKVNRKKDERGFCKAGLDWKIFGAHPHYGEEPEIIVSGTIFQAACSMRCVYCQNAPQSITPELGEKWSIEKIVRWMRDVKKFRVRNINWVGGSPTPWLWHILNAMKLCEASIAQVWNSNAYYSEKTAELLKGIIDVYLLDFRYFNNDCAIKFSSAPNYPVIAKRNFLTANKDAELLTRVLIIPNHIECDGKPILKWLRNNLGGWTRVNILQQYYPTWHANRFEEINRRLTADEYEDVVNYAKKIGLRNLVKD